MNDFSVFSKTIIDQKYAHDLPIGRKETWHEIAARVVNSTLDAVPYRISPEQRQRLIEIISQRKFIPGGRYLYAAGRDYHQVNNCILLRVEDSREGWSDLLHKSSMSLMTGAGIGIVYSDLREEGAVIKKTGGQATGPIPLMKMVNEVGRGIMQGGSRRSAIWAGLHWNHPDIMKFVRIKDWSPEVRELKEKDYNFPATLDGTNVSVILDDLFFEAFNDKSHVLHSLASNVFWSTVRQMLKTGEPGFSIDTGENAGENLRNAPVAGSTMVLTEAGYRSVFSIVDTPTVVWTGKRWAKDVEFKKTGENVPTVKVKMTGGRHITCDPTHEFLVERYVGAGKRRKLDSIEKVKAKDLQPGDILHVSLPEVDVEDFDSVMYTSGFGTGDGSWNGSVLDLALFDDKRNCAEFMPKGRVINDKRPNCDRYSFEAVPCFAKQDFFDHHEFGRMSASQKASWLAGLFDADGNYEPKQRRIRLSAKDEGFLRNIARLLEEFGILAGVTKLGVSGYGSEGWQLVVMSEFNSHFAEIIPTKRLKLGSELDFTPYRNSHIKVVSVTPDRNQDVFCCDVKFEEHSFMAEGVIISNCTELTSHDDSDICNLGSINMARISSLEEMQEVVELATMFLLAGTIYSDVPYEKIEEVREKNRRLGLGLMGLHEWLLQRNKRYGPDAELGKYLEIYAQSTQISHKYADTWGISRPVKTRAVAPTGTIGIVAETTTGCEPIYCVAYKRRYLKGDVVHYQYVIDPTAKKLIEAGVRPEAIEDAYTLAEDVERRVEFQAWLQQYVDHAISSTINLPEWGSELNNDGNVRQFGEMLYKYLPNLRGVTVYPDGARGGQPLTPVSYAEAVGQVGEVFIEQVNVCDITKGGSCGE